MRRETMCGFCFLLSHSLHEFEGKTMPIAKEAQQLTLVSEQIPTKFIFLMNPFRFLSTLNDRWGKLLFQDFGWVFCVRNSPVSERLSADDDHFRRLCQQTLLYLLALVPHVGPMHYCLPKISEPIRWIFPTKSEINQQININIVIVTGRYNRINLPSLDLKRPKFLTIDKLHSTEDRKQLPSTMRNSSIFAILGQYQSTLKWL